MIMIGMVAIASATSILLREKIEKMLAPTIMVMVLLTYAFLNMGIPAIGLYITMFASVISVGVIVYFVFSDRKRIIECLATYGGLTIIILLGVLMIFSIGRRAVYGPDPGVWVGNVKKLYLNHPKSELVPTHPNFLIILGYLATKTWFRWAEGILLFAKDFFLMSCLVSFFAFVKNNTVLKSALLFFITVMIPFAQAGDSFGIFDVDGIMAITFGLALIYAAEYLKNRNNLDYCVFLIYLSSAVLTKRIAIIIATIILIYLTPYFCGQNENKKGVVSCCVTSLVYLLFFSLDKYGFIPLVGIVIACMFYAFDHIIGSKKNKDLFFKIIFVLLVGGVFVGIVLLRKFWMSNDGFTLDVTRTYINAIITTEKFSVNYFVPMSIGALIVLLLALRIGFINRIDGYERKIFDGLILLNIMYLLLFFFSFPQIAESQFESTGMYLAGFDRYMSFLIVIDVCYSLYIVLCNANNIGLITLMLATVISFSDVSAAYKYFMESQEDLNSYAFDKIGDKLSEGDVIGYIDMDKQGTFLYKYFAFLLDYIDSEVVFIDFDQYLANPLEYKAEIANQMAKCDYIYVAEARDDLDNLGLYSDYGIDDMKTHSTYIYDAERERLIELVDE